MTFEPKYDFSPKNVEDANSDHESGANQLIRWSYFLEFMHHRWWRIALDGFSKLPTTGPALIVGNHSGMLPWVELMAIYSLMREVHRPRQLHVLTDLDGINDGFLNKLWSGFGIAVWSADNARRLLSNGELVAIFPEGISTMAKPMLMQDRVFEFDWTRFMPAVEVGAPIFPMATLGCDESNPAFCNIESLAKFLNWKVFPVTPFFPILPFPLNLMALPGQWRMRILNPNEYKTSHLREDQQEIAKKQAFLAEGNIQAEINRRIRIDHRTR